MVRNRLNQLSTGIIVILVTCGWLLTSNRSENSKITVSSCESYEMPKWNINGGSEIILKRYSYTTSYNCETLTPHWVGWVLTSAHTDGEYARKGHMFIEDLDVPSPRAIYTDIREGDCGYQRGHMCPAGDNKWSYKAQSDAFLMTNICPQNGDLNQRDWKYLEEEAAIGLTNTIAYLSLQALYIPANHTRQ